MFEQFEAVSRDKGRRRIGRILTVVVVVHAAVLAAYLLHDYLRIPAIAAPQLRLSLAQSLVPVAAAPATAAETPDPVVAQTQETAEVVESVEEFQVPEPELFEPSFVPNEPTGLPPLPQSATHRAGLPGGGSAEGTGLDSLGVDTLPRLLESPEQPEYPELARMANIEGTVILLGIIRKDGSVGQIRVERDLAMGCTEAAIDYVKQRRYAPATKNGVPVEFPYRIEVVFELGP